MAATVNYRHGQAPKPTRGRTALKPRSLAPLPRNPLEARESPFLEWPVSSSEPKRALEGKVILVTGGGTGIGRATALEAGRRGARLCLAGRRASVLSSVAEELDRMGADCIFVTVDLADVDAPRQLVSKALSRYGGIDGVVNNAAVARFAPLDQAADDEMRIMFEVNLLAPLRILREALPALRSRRGCVVNVSSIGGVVATPRRVLYGALKAALNHATRSLARELSPEVRVNAVLPGPVQTPMYEDLGLTEQDARRLVNEMIATTPAGRMGLPEEVANWICWLLDGRSGWMTGSLVTVDGGRSA